MSPGSADFWKWALDSAGVSVVMLLFIGLCLWRFMRWAAPRADRIIESHLQFVRHTQTVLDEMSEDVDDHREIMASLETRQTAIKEYMEGRMNSLDMRIGEVLEALRQNTDATLKVVETLVSDKEAL